MAALRALLVGGGTGGSVTPLLAVAEELHRRQPDVTFRFLGTRHGPEAALATAAGMPFRTIPAGKLRRYFSFANVADLLRIAAGFFASLGELRSFRPHVVLTAGSFVSVPVVWAAWTLRIPSFIHQQDVHLGLANRLMAPFARRITVTFDRSLRDFPAKKATLTGNPVRRRMLGGSAARAREAFGLRADLPVVLALGGGTGALTLNQLVTTAAVRFIEDTQILHLTGGKQSVHLHHRNYHDVPFLLDQMADAYAVADLVISRAGLATLTEITALGKPAILIPLPNSPQAENAQLFAERGAALVFDEARVTPEELADAVLRLVRDPLARRQLTTAIAKFARPDAVERFVDVILSAVQHAS